MFAKNATLTLVANGEVKDKLPTTSPLIAVDGGLVHIDAQGLTPDLIIGDFDSAPTALLEKYVQVPQVNTPDQQKGDLEKAIDYLLPFEPKKMIVYGALGKRYDHALTNILLLTKHPEKLILESPQETMYVLNAKSLIKTQLHQTLSLIPLNGPVKGITTRGLKWELKDGRLDKNFVGLSNVSVQEEVMISHKSGDLLLCLNK